MRVAGSVSASMCARWAGRACMPRTKKSDAVAIEGGVSVGRDAKFFERHVGRVVAVLLALRRVVAVCITGSGEPGASSRRCR